MNISYIFTPEEAAVICSVVGRVNFLKSFVPDMTVDTTESEKSFNNLVKKDFCVKTDKGYIINKTIVFIFKQMHNCQKVITDENENFLAYFCDKMVVCVTHGRGGNCLKITPLQDEESLNEFLDRGFYENYFECNFVDKEDMYE